jgi:hypothetical protein
VFARTGAPPAVAFAEQVVELPLRQELYRSLADHVEVLAARARLEEWV